MASRQAVQIFFRHGGAAKSELLCLAVGLGPWAWGKPLSISRAAHCSVSIARKAKSNDIREDRTGNFVNSFVALGMLNESVNISTPKIFVITERRPLPSKSLINDV